MATTSNPWTRGRTIDAAVVAGALSFSLLQLILGGGFGDFDDATKAPDAVSVTLVVLSALALWWRHRWPKIVLGVTLMISLVLAALAYGVHAPVPPAIALYTIAVHPQRGRKWPVLAATAAAWPTLVLIEASRTPYGVADYVVPGLIWAGAWLLGDRRRFLRAHVAAQLERARHEHDLAITEERARIARELHDSAAHALNTILVQAGAARVLRNRDAERSAASVATIEVLARETIEDIDRIVGLLREDWATDTSSPPGIDQIPALVERQRAGGLDVTLTIDSVQDVQPPSSISRTAYRIAQESLTNASRHGTGSAAMTIRVGTESLDLSIHNPITSRTEPRSGGGHGIPGMRERVELLGGSLSAASDGPRFVLRARLPYEPTR